MHATIKFVGRKSMLMMKGYSMERKRIVTAKLRLNKNVYDSMLEDIQIMKPRWDMSTAIYEHFSGRNMDRLTVDAWINRLCGFVHLVGIGEMTIEQFEKSILEPLKYEYERNNKSD